MNDKQKQLIEDMLADSAPASWRDAMLTETLRHARRRRHWRHARQAGVALAAVALVGYLLRPGSGVKTSPKSMAKAPAPAIEAFKLVETQPLPPGMILSTKPFVSSNPPDSNMAVAQISTVPGGYHLIGDAELLAMIGPRPALLIRTGPESEQLVFCETGGAKETVH